MPGRKIDGAQRRPQRDVDEDGDHLDLLQPAFELPISRATAFRSSACRWTSMSPNCSSAPRSAPARRRSVYPADHHLADALQVQGGDRLAQHRMAVTTMRPTRSVPWWSAARPPPARAAARLFQPSPRPDDVEDAAAPQDGVVPRDLQPAAAQQARAGDAEVSRDTPPSPPSPAPGCG